MLLPSWVRRIAFAVGFVALSAAFASILLFAPVQSRILAYPDTSTPPPAATDAPTSAPPASTEAPTATPVVTVVGSQPAVATGINPALLPPGHLKTRETDPIVVQTYAVQPGDTLFRIALRAGVSVRTLLIANGLRPTTTFIYPGEDLIIPESTVPLSTPVAGASSDAHSYPVQGGDTLFRIARAHGITVQALMAANHLTSTLIRSGQTLVIP